MDRSSTIFKPNTWLYHITVSEPPTFTVQPDGTLEPLSGGYKRRTRMFVPRSAAQKFARRVLSVNTPRNTEILPGLFSLAPSYTKALYALADMYDSKRKAPALLNGVKIIDEDAQALPSETGSLLTCSVQMNPEGVYPRRNHETVTLGVPSPLRVRVFMCTMGALFEYEPTGYKMRKDTSSGPFLWENTQDKRRAIYDTTIKMLPRIKELCCHLINKDFAKASPILVELRECASFAMMLIRRYQTDSATRDKSGQPVPKKRIVTNIFFKRVEVIKIVNTPGGKRVATRSRTASSEDHGCNSVYQCAVTPLRKGLFKRWPIRHLPWPHEVLKTLITWVRDTAKRSDAYGLEDIDASNCEWSWAAWSLIFYACGLEVLTGNPVAAWMHILISIGPLMQRSDILGASGCVMTCHPDDASTFCALTGARSGIPVDILNKVGITADIVSKAMEDGVYGSQDPVKCVMAETQFWGPPYERRFDWIKPNMVIKRSGGDNNLTAGPLPELRRHTKSLLRAGGAFVNSAAPYIDFEGDQFALVRGQPQVMISGERSHHHATNPEDGYSNYTAYATGKLVRLKRIGGLPNGALMVGSLLQTWASGGTRLGSTPSQVLSSLIAQSAKEMAELNMAQDTDEAIFNNPARLDFDPAYADYSGTALDSAFHILSEGEAERDRQRMAEADFPSFVSLVESSLTPEYAQAFRTGLREMIQVSNHFTGA